MQRLRRVRLRHLHVPAVSDARYRGMHPRRASGWRRPGRLLPQGRPGARRGDEVSRRQREQLFPAYRMRRRRAGHALPAVDARRFALARRAPHPPPRVDEQHQVRRDRRRRHRRWRADTHSRRTRPGRRTRRDRRQSRGRLLLCRRFARCACAREHEGEILLMLAVSMPGTTELLSPAAIRERCGNITRAVEAGQSNHFRVDRTKIDIAARLVADVTRRRYRNLDVPYHSRWRHFDAGGRSRVSELDRHLACYAPADRLRAQIDLTVASVLLDAGAGSAWRYREPGTIDDYTRSEGVAVASFHAFMGGAWSASPGEPLRVDAAALTGIDTATFAQWFQVTPRNPLVALDGRAALLRRLGDILETRADRFGLTARPSALFHRMQGNRTIAAPARS